MTTLQSGDHAQLKFPHLARSLREQIQSGALRAGDRLPSFAEMQQQFQVTSNTVNRALLALEQDGLIVRERGRGIFVAQAEERPSQGVIGVSGSGFFNANHSYWANLLHGIRRAAREKAMHILHLDHNSRAGWEKANGVLICDWASNDVSHRIPPGMPCVSLMLPVEEYSWVIADDYSGGRLATEHLLQLGHRRIAFLHGVDDFVVPRRLLGYREAMRAAGVRVQAQWMRPLNRPYYNDLLHAGRDSMASWLREGFRQLGCTALLAHNDEAAIGIIEALRGAGLNTPRDISVIGFDGVEICDYCNPRLTSVAVPLREIGATATRMLQERMAEDCGKPQHEVLPVAIKEGASTSALSRQGK